MESLRSHGGRAPLEPVLVAALSDPRTALLAFEHLVAPGLAGAAAEYWALRLAVEQRDRWGDPDNFWTRHKVVELAELALHLPATYALLVPLLARVLANERTTQRPLVNVLERAIPRLQPVIEVQLVGALSRVAQNEAVRSAAKDAVIALIHQRRGKAVDDAESSTRQP